MYMIQKTVKLISRNMVLVISFSAALATSLIIHPDARYLEYFDLKTLTCLFCVLSVIGALRNIRFFTLLAQKTVAMFKNTRTCILSLVYITLLGSMLITNDMALLIFLPLCYFILKETGKEKYMAYAFVLLSVAANLGGMLTPFGNPQNLYLYSKYNISNAEFVKPCFLRFLCLSR